MKCSKTFTLRVEPADTVCPVYQATVALGVALTAGDLAFYSASATVGVPNKYFANGLASMIVINADTRAIVTTVALGTRYPYRHGVPAPGTANAIVYVVNDSATGLDRIEAMDVDSYAVRGTAYGAAGDSYEYVEYDSVNNEIGSIFIDGATVQPYFRRHNATTMALINSTVAGAIGSGHHTLSFDAVRDRYYTAYNSGGAWALRGYDRTTGALALNVPFIFQLTAVVYNPDTDEIYCLDVNSNFYQCNAATGAVENTVAMGAINGLRPAVYWPNNHCLVGMCQNALGNDIIGRDGTHVCNLNGNGVAVGLFNDELAMREWATHDLLIYSI